MRAAGQRTITASGALGLVHDHRPLMFTFGRFAGCPGSFDRLRTGSNRDANSGQFEKIAAVDVLVIHSFPRRMLRASRRGDKSARATEQAPYRRPDRPVPR